MDYLHIIRNSLIFAKFRKSDMGVATVTFPQGLEFSNFFLRYYRPIRGNWWRKTFVINFFQVEPYFSLTIILFFYISQFFHLKFALFPAKVSLSLSHSLSLSLFLFLSLSFVVICEGFVLS